MKRKAENKADVGVGPAGQSHVCRTYIIRWRCAAVWVAAGDRSLGHESHDPSNHRARPEQERSVVEELDCMGVTCCLGLAR